MKLFLSLFSERREMRAYKNAILGFGVGSIAGPLALESFVLPCAPLHILYCNETSVVLSEPSVLKCFL